MLRRVKTAFIEDMESVAWMDNVTQARALAKVSEREDARRRAIGLLDLGAAADRDEGGRERGGMANSECPKAGGKEGILSRSHPPV